MPDHVPGRGTASTKAIPTTRKLPTLVGHRGREQPAQAEYRLDRPVPDSPPRSRHRHRRDPGSADRSTAPGKIRAFGSSTFPAYQMVRAVGRAERDLGRFVTEQPPYSLFVRGIETDVLPVAQEYGMGVLPWSPLAGGWLTGGYRKDKELPESRRRSRLPARSTCPLPTTSASSTQPTHSAARRRRRVVPDPAHYRIRHQRRRSPRDHRPPHPEHLKSQISPSDVTLSVDVLDQIDEIVPPE